MLFLKNRLKKEKDFKEVFSKGRTVYSNPINIRFFWRDVNERRVGIIVSKKVSKKAVTRNRVKRVLREQMREKIERVQRGIDIIIIAKRDILKLNFKEINISLEEVLKKGKILTK